MDTSPKLDGVAAQADPNSLSSSDSTLSTEITPIKWHNFHCDPIMDVVLVSNDGIYFRASSHALKRESSLFKGMLSSMPNPYQSSSDAILLDFSGGTLALFLSSYNCDSPIDYTKLPLVALHKQRTIVRYLDCSRLLPLVQDAYSEVCSKDPIDGLLLASMDNDLVAAESALHQCHAVNPQTYDTQFCHIIDQLRLTWRYPLMKRILRNRQSYLQGSVCISWPGRADVRTFVEDAEQAEQELKGAI